MRTTTSTDRQGRWHPARSLGLLGTLGVAMSLSLAGLPAQGQAPGSATSSMAASTTRHIPAAQPFCGIWWGSLAKTQTLNDDPGTLSNVRSGRHACFDRLVLDVADVPGNLGFDVRYVDVLRAPGSGEEIPLSGGADLQVILHSPAYDEDGHATYLPADPDRVVNVRNYDTFRQVAWAGSFEGQSTLGLGVRARLPFRVFVLDGPGDGARLVIDVAHKW